MDLINVLQDLEIQLTKLIKKSADLGIKQAECERAYKIKLNQECMKLKNEGMKVTLINQVIYGIPEVAELRFQRDKAEVLYKTNQDMIMSTKLQIRVIDNQIGREWGIKE